MFELLCFLGPAAVTFLIVRYFEREKKEPCVLEQIIFLMACAFAELVAVLMIFMPLGAVQIVTLANGMRSVHYGRLAMLGAFCIAVVLGVLISVIRKDIDISIAFIKKKEEK